MKFRVFSFWVLAILFLAASSAFAGQITLGGSNGYNAIKQSGPFAVNFTGTGGGNFSVAFNSNAFGKATGFGDLTPGAPAIGGNGIYTILQNGASVTTIGGCGSNCYNLSQTGNIIFDFGNVKGSGLYLTGNLALVNVTQSGTSGLFNDNLLINLTVTGGTLKDKFFQNNGIVQLTIAFKTGEDLMSIGTQALGAWIHSGTVNPAVPEPASLLMLTASLLGFAGLLRKKNLSIG